MAVRFRLLSVNSNTIQETRSWYIQKTEKLDEFLNYVNNTTIIVELLFVFIPTSIEPTKTPYNEEIARKFLNEHEIFIEFVVKGNKAQVKKFLIELDKIGVY